MDEHEPRHRQRVCRRRGVESRRARKRPDRDRDAVPDDGAVDFEAFQALARAPRRERLRRHRRRRHDGESPTLTDTERLDLSAPRSRPSATRDGRRRHRHVLDRALGASHRAGARARRRRLLVVTPYYNKPPQRGIVAHFEAIAARDRPADRRLQHPGRVVVNIEPETISRLAEIETVRAVKQANDDLDQARHIVETGPRPLRGRRQPRCSRSSSSAGSAAICVHTHVVGPQVAEQVRAASRATSSARGGSTRARARLRAARGGDEPDRDQGGARPARPRGRRPSPAARAGDGRRGGGACALPGAPRPARQPRRR